MYATTNSNDASNEQLTRLRNMVWLWCISEGYEDVSTGGEYLLYQESKDNRRSGSLPRPSLCSGLEVAGATHLAKQKDTHQKVGVFLLVEMTGC